MGYYAGTVALLAWLKLGGDLGLSTAMVKRISEGDNNAEYTSAGALLIGAFFVCISILIYLNRSPIDEYTGGNYNFAIPLLGLALSQSIIKAILNGHHRVHIAGVIYGIRIATRSLVQIILVFAGMGLTGMVFGYGFGFLMAILVGIIFAPLSISTPKTKHITNIFSYAKYSWLGEFENRTFKDVDIVVLAALVSPSLVGIYSITWSISQFLNIFNTAIRQVMFPEISRAQAHGAGDEVGTLVNRAITFSGLFMIPGVFGSVLLGEEILSIYGPEFAKGDLILTLLILASLIYGYQRQFLNALNGIDRPDISFKINLIFIVLNIFLNGALILVFGWTGAAVATILSALIGLFYSYTRIRSQIDFSLPIWEITLQLFASSFMGIALAIFRRAVQLSGVGAIFSLLILISTGVVLYFTTLYLISPLFNSTVRHNLPNLDSII
ncbi:polysaccharide biosynthesis C-terminal domain-containing protein [Halorarum halophilum]|uniref:Polysaccharide biosynthesis C-terminal domain-containing protein n=2 Tax=Halorarum halophilum TaxID=2743090 RepID=A0A7D5KF66_9EURY|nr:polysaccharide biosynthesis C-terminal domain-containing protein [Halobaculum halophilum]